jgi:hypothetical protein
MTAWLRGSRLSLAVNLGILRFSSVVEKTKNEPGPEPAPIAAARCDPDRKSMT